MKKYFLILILFVFVASLTAQIYSDPTLRRIGYHTGNRVGISYYNDGQIAGFNIGIDIRGEWPIESGENYIGDLIPLIAGEFVNTLGDTIHSVTISRGPRNRQGEEKSPIDGHFWGWNPVPGYLNPNGESVAMSHLPNSYPIGGWGDPEHSDWVDAQGNTEWWGYFGRGVKNADQESFFLADDNGDDEFNANFSPDANDPNRKGMALTYAQRGFQWQSFLAEDAIFWLYDITNTGTYTYRKMNFGTVVGTLAGGDGDSGDDLGFFDAQEWITYSWDSDNNGNKGQKVGYVGYSFLESPGNPFDGIDNDGDSGDPNLFVQADFDAVIYNIGDKVVLIDQDTYERTLYTITQATETVYSLGVEFVIQAGVTSLREGHIGRIVNGVAQPDASAYDGIDNDLDGLIDENQTIAYDARVINNQDPLAYIDYFSNGSRPLLIDERRDNDIDEDGDWSAITDDLGADGLGPDDENYPGPDFGEGDGIPTQGEPNFGKTDPDESDQIGLTAFNFFNNTASPDMTNDSLLWSRMVPGRFDVIPAQPQDGDFIYASGFFPLPPQTTERFSVALLFGEDRNDIFGNKVVVQQIYNAGYKFPQPPRKPLLSLSQKDGKVVLYWDGSQTESTRDFITKTQDFQGYKIYRATDAGFNDARSITNALGVLAFDKPIAQYDLIDNISGFFYPSAPLLSQVGGTTFYLGENNGIVNTYIDSTVTPGITYYYRVSSYDSGVDSLDVFPAENLEKIFRSSTGEIITDDNTGYITPAKRPIGYVSANVAEITKAETFRATGSFDIEIISDNDVIDGYKYQVVFQDSSFEGYTKSYSLIDLNRADTVLIPATGEIRIVQPNEEVILPIGTDTVFVDGIRTILDTNVYVGTYDTLINASKKFVGSTDINDGFRLQIYNQNSILVNTELSGFEGISADSDPAFAMTQFKANRLPDGVKLQSDYQIEFFDSIVDTSVADTLFPPIPANIVTAKEANFKVKNLTTNNYVDFVFLKFGTVTTGYSIWFKEKIEGAIYRTWRVDISYRNAGVDLEKQGSLNLFTTKPFNKLDSFIFQIKGSEIDNELVSNDLNKIKVVPNPYVVTHSGEQRLLSSQTSGRGERNIRFTHVPPGAKISIFTVRGEKIRELYQDNLYTGDVKWNLRTEENLDAAFGVYVYVVEIPKADKKIGKFALIK